MATTPSGILRLSGVIDFENALAGDPLMDVAKSVYYAVADERQALLAGYGAMNRLSWAEELNLYHLYHVLELWCWMAQIGNEKPLARLALDLEDYSTV